MTTTEEEGGGMSEFSLEECVSSEATWKLWSEKTQRDQKNPSKNQCPASRKQYYCLVDKPCSREGNSNGSKSPVSWKQRGHLTLARESEWGSRAWGLEWSAISVRKKRDKSHQWGLEELEASPFGLGWRGGLGGRWERWERWRVWRAADKWRNSNLWSAEKVGWAGFIPFFPLAIQD